MNGNSPKPVLERHDLGAPGREIVQVRVDFDSGTAFGNVDSIVGEMLPAAASPADGAVRAQGRTDSWMKSG